MFAKLKKKIEEEVGDLGQLTNPLQNAFSPSGDKRVGGSTQGTNTPNTIGSRQSSLASLVDIGESPMGPGSAATSPNSNSSATSFLSRSTNLLSPTPVPSGAGVKSIQLENELKRVNTEWTKKFEGLKKSYDDKFQDLEADFAWKISGKDEELEKLREEKKRLGETIKILEESYTTKMSRVHKDMDQLEGFTSQEMVKVKQLLHNTQSELQTAQAQLIEITSELKEAKETNRNLKVENETILRNLDRDRLQSIHFENELKSKTAELDSKSTELHQLSQKVAELNSRNEQLKEFEASSILEIGKLRVELENSSAKIKELEQNSCKNCKEFEEQLKTMKANLTEVEQLLNQSKEFEESSKQEIERLKHELENSATKIQEHEQYSCIKCTELEGSLKSMLESKEGAIRDLEAQSKQVEVLQSELQSKEIIIQELRTKSQQLEILKSELQTKETEIEELRAQSQLLKSLKSELESKEAEVRALEAQSKQFEVVKSELQSKETIIQELQTKSQQLESLKSGLENKETEIEKLRAQSQQLENLKSELESRETIIQKLQLNSQQREQEIDNLRLETKQLAALQSQVESKDAKIQELQTKLAELESFKFHVQRAQANLTEALTKTTSNLMEAKETNRKLKLENETLILRNLDHDKQQSIHFEHELQSKSAELEAKSAELHQLSQKVAELNSRNEQLKEFEASSILEIGKLRVELENSAAKIKEQEQSFCKKCTELEGSLKSMLESKEAEIRDLEAQSKQVHVLKSELQSKEITIQELQLESQQSKDEIDDLRLETQQLAALQSQMESKDAEIQELQTKSQELESLKSELQTKEAEIQELRTQSQLLESLQSDLESKDAEIQELRTKSQQLERLKSELQTKETEIEELRGQSKLLESLKSELESKETEIHHLIQRIEELAMSHQSTLAELNETKTSHNFSNSNPEECDKCTELEEKLNEYEQFGSELELASKQSEIQQLTIQISQLKSKVQELSDTNQSERLKTTEIEAKLRQFETVVDELQRKNIALEMEKHESITKDIPQQLQQQSNNRKLPDSPAVIESSNSFHLNSNSNSTSPRNALTEDVNFQYMKSVIFKYVTTSDPQVTQHLTKVVSTLLHLTPEENRMLEKSTDKRVLSWIGSGREHHY